MVLVLITDLLQNLVNSASAISVVAGIPNLRGNIGYCLLVDYVPESSLFTKSSEYSGNFPQSDHYRAQWNMDASRVSSVYKDSATTITVDSMKVGFYISY